MGTKKLFEQNLVEVKFYMNKQKKAKKSSEKLIYARFKHGEIPVQVSSQIYADPDTWNPQLHCVDKGDRKTMMNINSSLAFFAKTINTCYCELYLKKRDFSVDLLKQFITTGKYEDDPEYTSLIAYFEYFNQKTKKRVGIDLEHKTYTRYETALTRTKLYIKRNYNGAEDVPFEKLNLEFVKFFYIDVRKEYKIAHNTALKYVEKLLTVITDARDNINNNPIRKIKYKFTWEEIDRDILNDDELLRMCRKRLVSQRLEEIRDYYIFACFTGLAYIDLYNLTYDDIYTDQLGQYIDIRRHKTSCQSIIRLMEISLCLIEKYRNHPKTNPNKVFPMISNQKINDYMKEIGAMCGINKKLTFHTARHTFATTVSLCQGLPLETLQKVMGHKSIRTTQIYAKIVDKKLHKDMGDLAEKIKEMNIQLNLNNK